MRLAVLIHAESVLPAAWAPLSRLLADLGEVVIARAHADWTTPQLDEWLPVLRRHRIQVRHQFCARSTQDPALIALALDAVELDGRVDGVVLVGDVRSAMPVLERLRERGTTVVVVGPPSTPLDIRDACAEFIDLESLPTEPHAASGRHRALP